MKHFTRFCGSFAAGMFVAAALCSGVCVVADAQDVPAYRDAKLPVEDRVADLIGRVTLDEKVAQLEGTGGIQNDRPTQRFERASYLRKI